MIDFYYAPTPNGWKIAIMLEECGLEYNTVLMKLSAGDQFKPEFLAISPNAKMPAIVDHDVPGDPVNVFESGAIFIYLAEKTGQFMPENRIETLQWLFWQAANQGPMAGQLSHFVNYAPEGQDYSRNRYAGEYDRNLAVLERRLEGREYILDDYSIVDMMAFPWAFIAKPLTASLDKFPNVAAWRRRIKERPAVRNAINLHKGQQNRGEQNAENNKVLYNQNADHLLGVKG
ncbi:MAG: glutathione S-transferase family protein [Aestuariivirgaceae bacterium]